MDSAVTSARRATSRRRRWSPPLRRVARLNAFARTDRPGYSSPTSRTRGARRCCSPRRARRPSGCSGSTMARVDEIDRAVAVAILKHHTRLEQLGQRRRDSLRPAPFDQSPRRLTKTATQTMHFLHGVTTPNLPARRGHRPDLASALPAPPAPDLPRQNCRRTANSACRDGALMFGEQRRRLAEQRPAGRVVGRCRCCCSAS